MPTPTDDAVIEIERMRRRHVRSVLAIEERIFPRPWSQALYLSELAQPATRFYSVALVGGDVIGYIGCMLIVGEAHITTDGRGAGVAPPRQGWGRFLMAARRDRGAENRSGDLCSPSEAARLGNHGAQELYLALRPVPAGIRKNRRHGGGQ